MSKKNRLKRSRQKSAVRQDEVPPVIKMSGTPPPLFMEGTATGAVAVDMRGGGSSYLDMKLKHSPSSDGTRSVQLSGMYIGGYGPDFRRCICGLHVSKKRNCPKCGRTPDESIKSATPEELSAPLIRDRIVDIHTLPRDAERYIRNKEFHDCDIVGPAVLLPARVSFRNITTHGAPGGIESILWPINPSAERMTGAIGIDQCRFENCLFIDIGFAGNTDILDSFRTSVQTVAT